MSAMNCHMGCVNSTAARFNCPSMRTNSFLCTPRHRSTTRVFTCQKSNSGAARLIEHGASASLPRSCLLAAASPTILSAQVILPPRKTRSCAYKGQGLCWALCLLPAGFRNQPSSYHFAWAKVLDGLLHLGMLCLQVSMPFPPGAVV